ncbi:hypothetical protein [Streptomyces beihaiensis]|uniref:Integral membrane protein n=1 Tax=Streptomyces beihaiensis TaxID=2984495 RepID=A0ABT3TP80_9ACTN|nr:hypothetical protein [Streptomyces beihaiensis]MCX3058849.1 hypothetical protein [Streptomyces beihaiensis]
MTTNDRTRDSRNPDGGAVLEGPGACPRCEDPDELSAFEERWALVPRPGAVAWVLAAVCGLLGTHAAVRGSVPAASVLLAAAGTMAVSGARGLARRTSRASRADRVHCARCSVWFSPGDVATGGWRRA